MKFTRQYMLLNTLFTILAGVMLLLDLTILYLTNNITRSPNIPVDKKFMETEQASMVNTS